MSKVVGKLVVLVGGGVLTSMSVVVDDVLECIRVKVVLWMR